MATALPSFAQLVDYAQVSFLPDFSALPPLYHVLLRTINCECCKLHITGIIVGQAHTRAEVLDRKYITPPILMIAAIHEQNLRIYLVKQGKLFRHTSYALEEAVHFAVLWQIPFGRFAAVPTSHGLEAIARYYLWAYGDERAAYGLDSTLMTHFKSACAMLQSTQPKTNLAAHLRASRHCPDHSKCYNNRNTDTLQDVGHTDSTSS